VSGLRAGEEAGGVGAVVEHPVVQVVEAQRRQLAAAGSAVGGEADHKQDELAAVSVVACPGRSGVVGDGFEQRGVGGAEQGVHRLVGQRAAATSPAACASASSRVPWTVIDRCRVWEPAGSMPTATRTSNTPGRGLSDFRCNWPGSF
jgi:hypothetical protein